MRSTSRCPERTLAALALAVVCATSAAHAQTFPIFAGDPVDVASGRAFQILPGVPLILPQANGKFDPPIVVDSSIGDVDLVVRAGSPAVGPGMPPPTATPPVAIAGGNRIVGGSEIPFTVIVSDGSAGTGVPLLGPDMDGLPVIVFAFADLDGDGVVGPTNADPDGAADNVRELQESSYLVGRTAAIFSNGVAQGSVAVWRGAPASSGGLHVVLTAGAYVGPFSSGFMLGNVPDGPGVATLLPFFPRLDPDRVIESSGRGGPAGPEVRLGIQLEPAFDPPVDDPVLGTPFALPVDGTSPTIDRAVVQAGAMTRVRFVQPSVAAGFPLDVPVALMPGADGALFEPLTGVTLRDDGAGGGVHARVVPVDLLDDVTDPPPGVVAVLTAGPGLRIASPDADGDPTRETIAVASAAGVDVVLDDAGGPDDGPAASRVALAVAGVPADELAVTLVPSGATTTSTSVTTTSAPGGGSAPTIAFAGVTGNPAGVAKGCTSARTLVAVVIDADGDTASVSAAVTGAAAATISLALGVAPADMAMPRGPVFVAPLAVTPAAVGTLAVRIDARDAAGHDAAPVTLALPVLASVAPVVAPPAIAPSSVPSRTRTSLTMTARASDDCGVKRVALEIDRGKGFRRFARLRDDGKRGDVAAADGLYTATKRVRLPAGTFRLRATARNKARLTASSAAVTLQATP